MLNEMTVEAYIDLLASETPTPGGGSAAALSGAQGAALGSMVTGLSIGRKKYVSHTEVLTVAHGTLLALARELVLDIDRDSQAYDAVSAAMKLPRTTPEEQTHRSEAVQHALLAATRSPMNVLKRAAEALGALNGLVGRSNVNAASDLGTGAAMLRAAAQGSWLNILINLGSLTDAQQVSRLLAEGRVLYELAIGHADAIFAQVEALCMPEEE